MPLLAQHGGVLPLSTKLVRAIPRGGSEGEQWYLVSKVPVVSGREMRNARAGQDEFRKWETELHPLPGRRQAFRPLHRSAISATAWRWCSTTRIVSVATIQSAHRGFRPHHQSGQRAGGRRSFALPAFRLAARRRAVRRRALHRSLAGRRLDPRRASSPASPGCSAVIVVDAGLL